MEHVCEMTSLKKSNTQLQNSYHTGPRGIEKTHVQEALFVGGRDRSQPSTWSAPLTQNGQKSQNIFLHADIAM